MKLHYKIFLLYLKCFFVFQLFPFYENMEIKKSEKLREIRDFY